MYTPTTSTAAPGAVLANLVTTNGRRCTASFTDMNHPSEPGLDLFGVRVVQVGEDRQRRLPVTLGRAGIAADMVRVAEVGQRFCFVVPVAVVTEQRERLLVGDDGVGVPAE